MRWSNRNLTDGDSPEEVRHSQHTSCYHLLKCWYEEHDVLIGTGLDNVFLCLGTMPIQFYEQHGWAKSLSGNISLYCTLEKTSSLSIVVEAVLEIQHDEAIISSQDTRWVSLLRRVATSTLLVSCELWWHPRSTSCRKQSAVQWRWGHINHISGMMLIIRSPAYRLHTPVLYGSEIIDDLLCTMQNLFL